MCIRDRMNSVPFIDASGLSSLKELEKNCKRKGILLFLSEPNEEVIERLSPLPFMKREHLFSTLDNALKEASVKISSLPKKK